MNTQAKTQEKGRTYPLSGQSASVAQQNSEAVARFGARLAVLCKFVDAVLPHLAPDQCLKIDSSFRRGIEELLSRTEDIVTPLGYHTTLMEQTDVMLEALFQRSRMQR